MRILSACMLFAWTAGLPALADGPVLLRDDFRSGSGGAPTGWRLSGGPGKWETLGRPGGGRCISVTGNGSDSNYWRRNVPGLKPNTVYRISFWAKATPGTAGGSIISGLDVCNRDLPVAARWQRYTFCFTTPERVEGAFLRLGHWMERGTLYFTDVALAEAQPVSRHFGGARLCGGERAEGRDYEFVAPLADDGSNSSPLLVSHTAAFNTNRWVFTGGADVVYRHRAPLGRFVSAQVSVNVNYYTGGQCIVSASRDGAGWTELGRIAAQSSRTFEVPAALLPADTLTIRIAGAAATDAAGNSAPGAFQVDAYSMKGQLDASVEPARIGATAYLEVLKTDPLADVRIEDIGAPGTGGANALRLTLASHATSRRRYRASVTFAASGGRHASAAKAVSIGAGGRAQVVVPYDIPGTGAGKLSIQVQEDHGGPALFLATTPVYVPEYYAADYGYALGTCPGGSLWWCDGTYKISPDRKAPPASTRQTALRMSAARNEREHAQLVLRAGSQPIDLDVRASGLRGPGGAVIPASAIELREVAYVRVRIPSDRTGVAAEWPDPLPPLPHPWRPAVGRNNPIFVTIKVPQSAPAGDYSGAITLSGGGATRTIPLRLHVWNYTLPKRTALRSGFGINAENIRRYHNLRSQASLQKVWDLYMQAFAERGMCPFNPMALAPYEIRLEGVHWTGGVRDTSTQASGQASLKVVDESASQSVTASTADLIAVTPGKRTTISWAARTALPGQTYEVSLGCYDQNRQWIPYHNIDIQKSGSGEWRRETVDITDRIATEARFVSVGLRPVVWTERGEKTGAAWFDDVALHEEGAPANLIADGGFEQDNRPTVAVDFGAFDRAAHRYLDEFGFNSFAVNIPGLGGGRYPNYDNGSFLGYADGTPEYDALMTQFGKILQDHLASKGWLDKAYVYWYDEPETSDYPFVIRGMRKLHKVAPGLKRMLTEEFQKELFGWVDLWCPITPNYSHAAAAARQKLGEEVWWYVCTGPKEPYATLFIDHPAIELRMWLWQTWKYGVQGILIWDTTYWTSRGPFPGPKVQNPWEDPMSYVDAEPGTNAGVWGNGDGRFYYPPNRHPNEDTTTEYLSGPVISLRWEMLARGIQDWETFRLLERRIRAAEARGVKPEVLARAKALLRVPESICRDMVTFTRDPKPLLERRAQIARAIEALGGLR